MSRDSDQIAADFERASALLLSQRRVPLPQKKELQATAPPVQQTAPHSPEKSQEQHFQEELAELVKSESKRLQTERDKAEGLARLQQYANEQGLLETPENVALIQKWLDEKVKSYWSARGVDAAVANLRATLKWKPKTPPPAVAPAPVQRETIRLLGNGEPELPINATEQQMKKASIIQLRDLSRRRGEGRQTWRKGRTGASL
jgi:hypothetical protein